MGVFSRVPEMTDNMERTEKKELDIHSSTDSAETKLRSLERKQNFHLESQTEQSSSEEIPKKESLLSRAKELAIVGAAGTVLVGSSLLLGHEAMEHDVKSGPFIENDDVTQSQVIEKPNQNNTQFVESDVPISIDDPIKAVASEQIVGTDANIEKTNWWLSAPEQSQQNLTYRGTSTEYGCVPTSTSMVLDYWHQKDQSNPTMSAQELLDANEAQGEFRSTGMSATNIHDEVSKLGYIAEDHANADLETLKTAVSETPVIAIVKLGMGREGTNHSVVVTGISENNET